MGYSYYTYAIDGVAINKNNEEIIDIKYGNGKSPLHIFKNDLIDFVTAILSKKELKERGITLEKIASVMQVKGVEVLDELLQGRCMVLLTTFHNYLEYSNNGQNNVELITNLRIDGQIDMASAFNFKQRKPSYDDLYKSSHNK